MVEENKTPAEKEDKSKENETALKEKAKKLEEAEK